MLYHNFRNWPMRVVIAVLAMAPIFILALPNIGGNPTSQAKAAGKQTCGRVMNISSLDEIWAAMANTKPGDCIVIAGVDLQTPSPPQRQCLMSPVRSAAIGNTGTNDNDVIVGSERSDFTSGKGGYDTIFSYGGDDCIYGDDGADWIDGGSGNDLIFAGLGADTLYGGPGDDYINADDLTAIPEPGAPGGPVDGSPPTNVDFLDGGPGDDILIGGFGVDELCGGTGRDVCIGSDDGDSKDLDMPGTSKSLIDRMRIYSSWTPTGRDAQSQEAGNWLDKFHSCEMIWTTIELPNGSEGFIVVNGGTGDPAENMNALADSGNVLATESELEFTPTLNGSTANEYISGDNNSTDRISGLAGNDRIDGFGGDDFLDGGPDDDVLFGGKGNDRVWGGAGNDYLYGGAGSDFLYGGIGNDFLYGGDLSDTLDGGPGIDFCYGQSGVDTYKNCEFRIDIDDGEVVRL